MLDITRSTKDELLTRAKELIDNTDQSFRKAAEALAQAKQLGAKQKEMAKAIDKSEAWVSALLRWHDDGCKGSPFGPTTKAGRIQHAEDRPKRVTVTPPKIATAKPVSAKTPVAKRVETPNVQVAKDPDAKNLAEFKVAVDYWLPPMSDHAKRDAIEYAIKKAGIDQ